MRPSKRAEPAEASRALEAAAAAAAVAAAVPPAEASLAPVAPVSSLAEQNDLFSAAMAAERKGQHGFALSKLDELMTRFASGPLFESARAERDRILAAQGMR